MKDLTTMRRRVGARSVVAASAVLAATAVAACGSSSPASKNAAATGSAGSSYTLNVGYIGQTGHFTGPEGYAYSTGQLQKWLAADGITIKPTEFANGPLLTAAVTGGSIDLGILGDTPALIAKSKGLPISIINQGEVNLPAWIVSKKGGVTSIADLKGKTVGVPFGSYMYRYLEGVLQTAGLTGKVTLTNMLPPEAIAAAEGGSIDAVALPAYEVGPVIKAGGNVIAKSETTPSIEGTEVTAVTAKALSAHPQIAAEWNAARLKAVKYAEANPTGFYKFEIVADGLKQGVAEAKEFLPLSDYPDENYSPAGLKTLQGTLNFLVASGQASKFALSDFEAPGSTS